MIAGAMVEETPLAQSWIAWLAVAWIEQTQASQMTIVVDISSEIVRGSRPVDTLVAENVHHPALQLDVERNDHVVGVLH